MAIATKTRRSPRLAPPTSPTQPCHGPRRHHARALGPRNLGGRGQDRARAGPPPRARGDRLADAGDAAGGARSDDRLHGAADDRRGARRPQPPLVGGHRLPAGDHGGDAAVRQARRPLRAQARAPGGAGPVPGRLGALRRRPEHGRADRVPRDPGARRRRAHGQRPGGDRGRRLASRARPLHGGLRRRLRRRQRRRPADRRLLHHPRELALDLLHQRPARARGAGGAGDHPAVGARARPARDRLPGHGPARRLPFLPRPADDARRHHLRLGLAVHRRPRRARDRRPDRLRLRRAPRRRAGAPAAPVRQPGVPGDERDRAGDRLRAVRLADLPAAVPADRPRTEPDRGGAAADPADGGPARRVDHLGPGDLEHRPLQGVPDRRHRDRDDRHAAALAPGDGHRDLRGRRLHARARGRASGW